MSGRSMPSRVTEPGPSSAAHTSSPPLSATRGRPALACQRARAEPLRPGDHGESLDVDRRCRDGHPRTETAATPSAAVSRHTRATTRTIQQEKPSGFPKGREGLSKPGLSRTRHGHRAPVMIPSARRKSTVSRKARFPADLRLPLVRTTTPWPDGSTAPLADYLRIIANWSLAANSPIASSHIRRPATLLVPDLGDRSDLSQTQHLLGGRRGE